MNITEITYFPEPRRKLIIDSMSSQISMNLIKFCLLYSFLLNQFFFSLELHQKVFIKIQGLTLVSSILHLTFILRQITVKLCVRFSVVTRRIRATCFNWRVSGEAIRLEALYNWLSRLLIS